MKGEMKNYLYIELHPLVPLLKKLDELVTEEWYASLPERKVEEAMFHDKSHNTRETDNQKFYSIASVSDDYVYEWIDKYAPGRIVLDYACGNGDCAIRAAKAGAALSIGLDISRESINNTKRVACESAVEENSFFLKGDCENTGLPDNCIDVVICSGVLHHIDLSYAFPELRRIMKPGAVLIANEALNYNPFIKLYRRLTPSLRTKFEKEHIISNKELRFASYFFEVRNVKFWHFLSLLAVFFRNMPFFSLLLRMLRAADAVALSIPLLRNMAWQFTFELVKRKNY
jgi:ubiquinone/menaquinone biosynthesis C-methylase UbiE